MLLYQWLKPMELETPHLHLSLSLAFIGVQNAVDSTAAIDELQAYSQFDIAVAMLTEFWYQNRGAVTTASQEPPYSVVSMIQQLRGLFTENV